MTDEQHTVREQILKNFIIPEKYNLLIINASCATSIKIKSRVDYIIINSSHEDTQIQVRGRYTGDLDIIYLPAMADMIQVKIPDAFLARRLFSAFRTDIIVLLPFLKKNNAKIVYILKEYLQNWQLKLIRQKRLIYMNRFLYIVKNKDFRSSRKRKDTL